MADINYVPEEKLKGVIISTAMLNLPTHVYGAYP